MMIGHAALAFILVTVIASYLGYSGKKLFVLGIGGAFFATLPDVDMAYAFLMAGGDTVSATTGMGLTDTVSSFWGASHEIHRKVTHSVLFGVLFSGLFVLLAFGYQYARRDTESLYRRLLVSGHLELVAGIGIVGLVGVTYVFSGSVGAGVLFLFAIIGVIGVLSFSRSERWGLSPAEIGGVALVGLVSHPFGDVFTGTPPALFYPLDVRVLPESAVTIVPESTLNLLAIFLFELLIVGAAVGLVFVFSNLETKRYFKGYSTFAVLYGISVLFLNPPTLDVSYHVVFSVVGIGLFLGFLSVLLTEDDRREQALAFAPTSVLAIIFGVMGYSVAYVVLSLI